VKAYHYSATEWNEDEWHLQLELSSSQIPFGVNSTPHRICADCNPPVCVRIVVPMWLYSHPLTTTVMLLTDSPMCER